MQNIMEFGSGDNTTISTSSHTEPQHAPINRVTMKLPPFYRTKPVVWFRRMESQFVVAGITNDTTKYHHILAAIPETLGTISLVGQKPSVCLLRMQRKPPEYHLTMDNETSQSSHCGWIEWQPKLKTRKQFGLKTSECCHFCFNHSTPFIWPPA